MKWHWMVLSLVLAGCVSPAVAPPPDRLAQVKQAHVVPMQARPLGVPAGFRAQLPAAATSISAARGVAVVNTIALFLELPEASQRRDEASRSLQAALDAGGARVVLEASLSNYEIVGEALLVQVHLKVIEPATGLVIARARRERVQAPRPGSGWGGPSPTAPLGSRRRSPPGSGRSCATASRRPACRGPDSG